MAKVILRQKAIEDLNTIWNYTLENWSEKQADKYYSLIKMACSWIGENPDIGKGYEGVDPNLLGLKSEKHIIFYQVISSRRVEVIRILHERMDLNSRIIE
jgi:toxin ParE1/3/4